MKTNVVALTNTALSILIESLLLVLTVLFFAGWRTRAAVVPAMPWGWTGLFLWAGACLACLLRRDVQPWNHTIYTNSTPLQIDVWTWLSAGPRSCWRGLSWDGGCVEAGGEKRQGRSWCFYLSAPRTSSLCPWFWSVRCFVPLLSLPRPGMPGSEGQRLVPMRPWWFGCQHCSPHPSLWRTEPSAFLVPGSHSPSAVLPKAKLPRVSPVPGPVPGHHAHC